MKKLQLPSSYAVLSEEEQRTVSGGGELKDSLDDFFGIHAWLGVAIITATIIFFIYKLTKIIKNEKVD